MLLNKKMFFSHRGFSILCNNCKGPVMHNLGLIMFVVTKKKALIHIPIV